MQSLISINSQDIVHECLDGEVVIVNLKNGRYYNLVDTATTVWLEIDAGRSSQQIENHLRSQFRDEQGQIPDTLAHFLRLLATEGLVNLSPDDSTHSTAVEPVHEPDANAAHYVAPTLSTHVDMEGLLLLDPVHDVSEQGWPEKKAT
jgi:hypothetical protein